MKTHSIFIIFAAFFPTLIYAADPSLLDLEALLGLPPEKQSSSPKKTDSKITTAPPSQMSAGPKKSQPPAAAKNKPQSAPPSPPAGTKQAGTPSAPPSPETMPKVPQCTFRDATCSCTYPFRASAFQDDYCLPAPWCMDTKLVNHLSTKRVYK